MVKILYANTKKTGIQQPLTYETMPLDQPLFVPTLVNNTNPLDFIIYTYESANPGSAFASAFWGSVAQAFILGVILISVGVIPTLTWTLEIDLVHYHQASKCYWTYVGADGWLNITIVTVLLMVTMYAWGPRHTATS